MNTYKKLNTILGWIIFAIASIVYISTTEPTASFWDCGEYIATAFKLQVGHPPGAPLFQLIGRFFTLFAFGNTALVAQMVNIMSALSSALTILFLFWSLTMLAKKMALSSGEMTDGKMYAVFGSAVVGSLAYTFSDSFWFSAVEGEVYAMSSFFTALVFWAILKWEENANEEHSFRWLIFIAYMMGLSIGVHLLNLLAIPAIAFVYYFKKYKNHSIKGMLVTFIISIFLLGFVMNIIIPWIVKVAGYFELFFVNTVGLPFNTGTIIYFVLLVGGIYWGIRFTRRNQKAVLNTIIWGLTFILIGYSSFFLLVIRSNVNTPINENSPVDAISLLAYLNREQYGDWPILYGPYFNAPVAERKDGTPVYRKNKEKGKYVIINERKGSIPVYNNEFSTIFPRMWNNTEQRYIDDYKKWSKMKGIPTTVQDEYGESKTLYKPTFGENLRYFFRYQLNHMYFRYFMWNFSGKQNDIQGTSDMKNGNWITGIRFFDELRLGPVLDAPKSLQSKATNKFYMFPFILGLIGLLYQFKKDNKSFIVILLIFIMTGLAIVVYLNQHSPQPRERDYAYAASFYAFAFWIGLGVYALFDMLSSKIEHKTAAIIVSVLSLLLVPGIMAKEGWDDHDRSGRYTALAIANNYLNSCAPNAILFTNGDNDTFPLWYAQEVEGIRTDVRVVNLSLLNTEWYIEQMKRKAYDSEPVPFSLKWDQYKDGTRNYTYFIENENVKGYIELTQLFNILKTNPDKLRMETRLGPLDFFPTKKFKLAIDSARIMETGTVAPEFADQMVDNIEWKINRSGVTKNYLMLLDLLATNNWERPIYFAITTGSNAYIGLQKYFQLEGLTYRLVPIKTVNKDGQDGRVDTDVMYDNLMNKFMFGNINKPGVYLDETNVRMTMNIRNNFYRLADALIKEGKNDSAKVVMDYSLEIIPDEKVPYNYFVMPVAEGYYKIGEMEKGNEIYNRMIEIFDEQLNYYFSFTGKRAKTYDFEKQQNLAMLQKMMQVANRFEQEDIANKASEVFDVYYKMYAGE
ncbi:MAG: hypothetical protein B6D61_10265 [Bacteroidetes bacterium 4484_249]|nr:MAG: hypothetical protein B6D61_10265 [Bacteroidetes bacterium 4484_249]